MSKVPKKAEKVLDKLDYIIYNLSYYQEGTDFFRKEILPRVKYIEKYITNRAVDQKRTFKEIAQRYEAVYEQKIENETNPKELPE